MSKDIHKWTDGRYTLMFDEHTFFVFDNEKEERMTALQTTEKLNEQQATIRKLQDLCGESDSENAKLRVVLQKFVLFMKNVDGEKQDMTESEKEWIELFLNKNEKR